MNTPPPVPPPPKRGLSGVALAGFGCASLFLVVAVIGFIFVGKACTKISEVAVDFTKNPAKSTALLVLKMHPNLEVISTDDVENEVTFKDKESQQIMTMSFEDVAQGKLTLKDSDGDVITINGSEAASAGKVVIKGKDGQESVIDTAAVEHGRMTIQSPKGDTTIVGGAVSELPPWVPVYPGATPNPGSSMKSVSGNIATGAIALESTDSVSKVKEFYEAKLKEAGYKAESHEIHADGRQSVILNATNETTTSTLNVVIRSEEGKTAVMVNYNGAR